MKSTEPAKKTQSAGETQSVKQQLLLLEESEWLEEARLREAEWLEGLWCIRLLLRREDKDRRPHPVKGSRPSENWIQYGTAYSGKVGKTNQAVFAIIHLVGYIGRSEVSAKEIGSLWSRIRSQGVSIEIDTRTGAAIHGWTIASIRVCDQGPILIGQVAGHHRVTERASIKEKQKLTTPYKQLAMKG